MKREIRDGGLLRPAAWRAIVVALCLWVDKGYVCVERIMDSMFQNNVCVVQRLQVRGRVKSDVFMNNGAVSSSAVTTKLVVTGAF